MLKPNVFCAKYNRHTFHATITSYCACNPLYNISGCTATARRTPQLYEIILWTCAIIPPATYQIYDWSFGNNAKFTLGNYKATAQRKNSQRGCDGQQLMFTFPFLEPWHTYACGQILALPDYNTGRVF